MPQARVMPELVLLPDGHVFIVNGAQTGVAGYGNVANRVGQSNADNPVFTPVVCSSGIPATNTARIYHSTASLCWQAPIPTTT
ncbi:hypothetical protein BDZ89DRAFT_1138891 [Hymenopellis radicata]|nr:hypothetical protein BDZ89DRAFT_1138891 [Hymenopellis radicata]